MQITTGAKYLFKILFLLCLMFAQTAFAGEVLRELPASINPQGKYVFFLQQVFGTINYYCTGINLFID